MPRSRRGVHVDLQPGEVGAAPHVVGEARDHDEPDAVATAPPTGAVFTGSAPRSDETHGWPRGRNTQHAQQDPGDERRRCPAGIDRRSCRGWRVRTVTTTAAGDRALPSGQQGPAGGGVASRSPDATRRVAGRSTDVALTTTCHGGRRRRRRVDGRRWWWSAPLCDEWIVVVVVGRLSLMVGGRRGGGRAADR